MSTTPTTPAIYSSYIGNVRPMYGRKHITTDAEIITAENVAEVLEKALQTHQTNAADIRYLYDYYTSKQDVLNKSKEVRPEINNIIVENHANEILSFKLGYTLGEPIQYIRRGSEGDISDKLKVLNDQMQMSDKPTCDSKLGFWIMLCGIGNRLIMPTKKEDEEYEDTSFFIEALDPRYSFVVKANDIRKTPLMGVHYVTREWDNTKIYTCYTKDSIFTIEGNSAGLLLSKEIKESDNPLHAVPIVEYELNQERMGCFEHVLTLLDALNMVQSNRMDDVVQYVNSFLALIGCSLDEEGYKELGTKKMLMLPEGTDAKYLSSPMQQSDVQTLADDLYDTIVLICGIPNRNGGSSTSDTGAAVQLRDGWETAESQAKSFEKMFKKSENRFLRIALRILNTKEGIDLKLSQIETKFARRYTDNILTKVQALGQLLDSGISPEIAVATCGIWNDPTDVYLQSKNSLEERWTVEKEETAVIPEGMEEHIEEEKVNNE